MMKKYVPVLNVKKKAIWTTVLVLLATMLFTGTGMAAFEPEEREMKVGERFEIGIDRMWYSVNPDIVRIDYTPCPAFPSSTHDYAVAVAPGYAVLARNNSTEIKIIRVKNGDFEIGDINQDGGVNSLDMAYIRGYLLGMEGFSVIGERKWEADVNGDGSVNSIDFAYMRMLLLGNIKELPKHAQIYKPIPTITSLPTPTISPSPTISATPTITPTQLPSPTLDPDKTNTIIRLVHEEPLDLRVIYPKYEMFFSVKLCDENGNPIEGRTIRWDGFISNGDAVTSAVTDENGIAIFSFIQGHISTTPYKEYYTYINLYFDGDEEYNPSVYQPRVFVCNNGGPQIPTPTPSPTPTITPTPSVTPTIIPTITPTPLPPPTLDPNKVNTVLTPVGEIPLSLRCWMPSNEKTFTIKLTDEDGNPVEGRTVNWDVYVPYYPHNREGSGVTDSEGCATFTFSQYHSSSIPYEERYTYVRLYFAGDSVYNPSIRLVKALVSNNGGIIKY